MTHATQSDIARKLIVIRISISKALRNHPDIPEAMKNNVKAAAEELCYTTNLIAQNLNGHRYILRE